MSAPVLDVLPLSDVKPSGFAQFGNSGFLYYEDARPRRVMASNQDSTLKCYAAGILPPTAAPSVAQSGAATSKWEEGDLLTIGYCFYSSRRFTFSRSSPTVTVTAQASPAQLVINAFQFPRDDAARNDIDQVIVSVLIEGLGGNKGLMCVLPTMAVDCSDLDFAGASLTFNLSSDELEDGFNMTAAEIYYAVPPAARYVVRHGNRLWLGGQPRSVALAATDLTVTAAQSFRGRTLAKLTLTGTGRWSHAHLYMALRRAGDFLGNIFDIESDTVAWLDVDVKASLAASSNFVLNGYNDRLWPTGYHTYNPGGIEVVYPETVNLLEARPIAAFVDRSGEIEGLTRNQDFVKIIRKDGCVQMAGGLEVNTPAPEWREEYGRAGTSSPRSICRNSRGDAAWWSEEGPVEASTGGVNSLAYAMKFHQFSRGGIWMSLASLPGLTMTWSRFLDGYVFGNVSVNGASNYFGLVAMQPQPGLFLFTGQEMTSNLLEYADSDGHGRILVGDGYRARVKRLFTPGVFTDVGAATDTAAAYTIKMTPAFFSGPSGQPFALDKLRVLGLILPGTTFSLEVTWLRDHYLHRDLAELSAADQAVGPTSYDQDQIYMDIPAPPGAKRFHAVRLSWSSASGLSGGKPAEVTRHSLHFAGEGGR